MRDIYSYEEIVEVLNRHGLSLCGEYNGVRKRNHLCDNDGYQYYVTLDGVIHRDDKPKRFHRSNPFTIDNMKNYIKLCGYTCQLLSTDYHCSADKLEFRCECGKTYVATWAQVLRGKSYCNFCSKSKRFDGLRDYTAEIRAVCEQRDYTLLTNYVHRCQDQFEYICNKHKNYGIQYSSYSQMVSCGRGCWHCGRDSIGLQRRNDESVYRDATERVVFVYVGVDYNNDGSRWKKANIHYICPRHADKREQIIRYNNPLRSNGRCRYCAGYDRTLEDVQNRLDDLNSQIDLLEYTSLYELCIARCRVCGRLWKPRASTIIYGGDAQNVLRRNLSWKSLIGWNNGTFLTYSKNLLMDARIKWRYHLIFICQTSMW